MAINKSKKDPRAPAQYQTNPSVWVETGSEKRAQKKEMLTEAKESAAETDRKATTSEKDKNGPTIAGKAHK